MQRKLSVRIIASLILSVMLFAMPVGAFLANSSTVTPVYAEEDVSGNDNGDASDAGNTGDSIQDDGTTIDDPSDSGNTGDSSDNGETGDDSGDEGGETGGESGESEDETEPTPEPEPVCICTDKCGQYDYNKDCPVCSADYTKPRHNP